MAAAASPSNINSSSGAVDIIIVKQEDNTYKSTPFHVRYGKYLAPYPFNLNVDLCINDKKIEDLCMTLSQHGIATFDGVQQAPIQREEVKEEPPTETVVVTPMNDAQSNDVNDEAQQQQAEEKPIKIQVDEAQPANEEHDEQNETQPQQPASETQATESKSKSRVRKRDKLRAFVAASWSYWSGSENEDEDEEEVKQPATSNKNDHSKAEKPRKRDQFKDYVKSATSYVVNTAYDYAYVYVQNQLESQWLIEEDVINVNNIPSNEQIQSLVDKLQFGKNRISFTIRTPSKMAKFKKKFSRKKKAAAAQSNEAADSDDEVILDENDQITAFGDNVEFKDRVLFGNVYLWKHTDKIVISDVDGTITKSDVGGHILPRIGFDYCQDGITTVINRVNSNGYRIIYLTARGIGQCESTRSYLFEQLNLPNGAVITSPSSIRASLYREVIQKRPQDFKIPTLNMVVKAFGGIENNPFYAGFGNRETDALTYRYFGLSKEKVFIIEEANHKKPKTNNETQEENEETVSCTYIKDYKAIFENVNAVFPKL